ncbi:MAG TPA: gamma-glutamyl-gamma-aminobutyrate hydrolase family protein [Actinobacteria bacterium]|nr:gamma-glutamyl-gamma-aminobutyrate hydrolase family protein [Actinomycetota bacterium]
MHRPFREGAPRIDESRARSAPKPPAAPSLARMRPMIGVTTQPKCAKSAAGDIESHVIAHTYTDAVLRAGGTPVLLVPAPDVSAILDRLDGLVLTGGGDIEAHRYGAEPHPTMRGTNFDRDEFEIALVREARRRELPVLAICRGLQVVNVAFGGTLIQDIPAEVGSRDHDEVGHAVWHGHQPVTLEPGCLVAEAIGETELMVNSIHHQAVRDLAPGFRAVGWAGDGIVEAIEPDSRGWPLLAVQWHPEYLGHREDPASLRLFDALVAAARSVRRP